VQQGGDQRLGVQAQPGADLRDADRVDDEVLPGLAALVGVVLAGEDERPLDAAAVDLDRGVLGVLLDDGEQVGQQPALERRQVAVADLGAVLLGVDELVDRGAARGQAAAGAVAVPVAAVSAVARDRCPSSRLASYAL
jgi:hypothetical protein